MRNLFSLFLLPATARQRFQVNGPQYLRSEGALQLSSSAELENPSESSLFPWTTVKNPEVKPLTPHLITPSRKIPPPIPLTALLQTALARSGTEALKQYVSELTFVLTSQMQPFLTTLLNNVKSEFTRLDNLLSSDSSAAQLLLEQSGSSKNNLLLQTGSQNALDGVLERHATVLGLGLPTQDALESRLSVSVPTLSLPPDQRVSSSLIEKSTQQHSSLFSLAAVTTSLLVSADLSSCEAMRRQLETLQAELASPTEETVKESSGLAVRTTQCWRRGAYEQLLVLQQAHRRVVEELTVLQGLSRMLNAASVPLVGEPEQGGFVSDRLVIGLRLVHDLLAGPAAEPDYDLTPQEVDGVLTSPSLLPQLTLDGTNMKAEGLLSGYELTLAELRAGGDEAAAAVHREALAIRELKEEERVKLGLEKGGFWSWTERQGLIRGQEEREATWNWWGLFLVFIANGGLLALGFAVLWFMQRCCAEKRLRMDRETGFVQEDGFLRRDGGGFRVTSSEQPACRSGDFKPKSGVRHNLFARNSTQGTRSIAKIPSTRFCVRAGVEEVQILISQSDY